MQGANIVAQEWDSFGADGCFVDGTGGYGAGWIDHLRHLGRTPIDVQFAGQANDPSRYANRRAEMYFEVVEWIRRGGALWRSEELKAALTQTTYAFKGDRLILEPKDQIKAKIGFSPDEADALVMTFAAPVVAATRQRYGVRKLPDYDPFASISRAMDHGREDYDPYR